VSLLPPLPAGSVRPVLTAPARALADPAVEVDPSAPEVVALAADLLATQEVSPGCVGLAAPQVGVGWRVFSLDVTGHPKARTCHGPVVVANPEVVSASRWERGREGCMSVPDLTGDVKRAARLVLRGVLPGTGGGGGGRTGGSDEPRATRSACEYRLPEFPGRLSDILDVSATRSCGWKRG
jgi:peptide deformylase